MSKYFGITRRAMTVWQQQRRRLSRLVFLAIGLLLMLTISACMGRNSNQVEIVLVGYAVPRAAHNKIIQQFATQWEQSHHGQTVVFRQSYGASGSQTRAVADGLEADVVHLAIGSDIDKLVKSGLIAENWQDRTPNKGIVAQTSAAILTKQGNPKQIKTFADLARKDVTWVTANPKTSGGARWNYYALLNYAQKMKQPLPDFMVQAFQNIVVLAKDSRESIDAFVKQEQGDAVVNYENEAFMAQSKIPGIEFVVPEVNLSIDTPVAMVDRNVEKHGNREVVEAFVKFLFSPDAQREFARLGFRPIGAVAQEPEFTNRFTPIKDLATIKDFGGWKTAKKVFDDGGDFDQIEAQAQAQAKRH
jgi:sulfate/thiosulfate transport system substrate-binding protein